MDGKVIANVKYREGHSNLGKQALRVQLTWFPSNLTVTSLEGRALFSIPWENFENAYPGLRMKSGLDSVGAILLGAIPVLDLFANNFYDGFWLVYWDNDIQREQQVFFDAGSERKAEQVVSNIFICRDHYFRQTRKASGPQRR
jgi:hypothetical protein